MECTTRNIVLHESQDERLKTLAMILSPGAAVLLLPLLFTRDQLLSFSGVLDGLIAVLGILFIASAFLTRYRLTVIPDRRALEITGRLLGWELKKKEYDLSTIRHVSLDWDDQPPFLTALVRRTGIHPVTLVLAGGQKELVLQSKSAEHAKEFAGLIQRLSDSAKDITPQR